MLAWHGKALGEFSSPQQHQSGLLVLGKGLGDWRMLVAMLRDLSAASFSSSSSSSTSKPLILLLNFAPKYAYSDNPSTSTAATGWIELCEWWAQMKHLPQSLDSSSLTAKRQQLYLQGGTYFVTSRILVVDLLAGWLDKVNLAGVVVWNAHAIGEMSNEAFAVRMCREKHPKSFVRAFSDSASAVATKSLAVLLKSLQIKSALLYPRFRDEVKRDLDGGDQDDDMGMSEICQPMPPSMVNIQAALVLSMTSTVDDMRKLPLFDTSVDFSVESVLFRNADSVLRQRWDAIWYSLSNKTRQQFEDLKMLKDLVRKLMRMDCVSFYEEVLKVKQAWHDQDMEQRSTWMFTKNADTVLRLARDRLYVVERVGGSAASMCRLVLEPNLKLEELRGVLQEIGEEAAASQATTCAAVVVVLVRDMATAAMVSNGLSAPSHLKRKFASFLKTNINQLLSADADLLKPELDKLEAWRAEESKREGSGGGGVRVRVDFGDDNFQPANVLHRPTKNDKGEEEEEEEQANDIHFVPQDEDDEDGKQKSVVVTIHLLGDVKRLGLLDLLQPSHVIVFDPDMAAMREIETYRRLPSSSSSSGGGGVQCYWLYYEDSYEEQAHQSVLTHERDAFLRLIQQKSELVFVSEETETPGGAAATDVDSVGIVPKRARPAESSSSSTTNSTVIVDVREFNAIFPNMLHQNRFQLDPRTLQVGDYILSPEICLERKSIADLISSFNDGRLFHQCTLMTRHYKRPVLLIEFPESGPFQLNSAQLASRLVLLCLNFPNLGVMWSKNVRCAVELFREMQRHQLRPSGDDAEKVMAAGQAAIRSTDDVDNFQAFELLQQLPGVTKDNCYRVARAGGSLAGLCRLTLAQLSDALGQGEHANAKVLFDFLRQDGAV